jgi:bacteriorhodopsin
MPDPDSRIPSWARKFRWLWFAIGVAGILQTPLAVISTIQMVRSDPRLAFLPFAAFPIRIVMIWLFFWLWWQTRPNNGEPKGKSPEDEA